MSDWPRGRRYYERRADNLMATLDRISDDLGGASAALTHEVDEGTSNFLDFNADNLFYSVKGKLYAYYLILRELEKDYRADHQRRRISRPAGPSC